VRVSSLISVGSSNAVRMTFQPDLFKSEKTDYESFFCGCQYAIEDVEDVVAGAKKPKRAR
jgi:hypothetical protein